MDRISGGRLILTLGVGGDYPKEFAATGVPLERRGRRTAETLEILRRYFSGERFSYRGEIFELEDVWLDPPPVQAGGPPLWVAGRHEATRRRAALLGDGFLPYMITAESFRGMCASVRDFAGQGGRELSGDYAFAAYLFFCLDGDGAAARRRADEHLVWRYDEPRFTGDLAGKYAVAGNAEECAEGLARFLDAGATHLVLFPIRPDGEPPLETLEAIAGGVLPLLDRA